MIKVSRENQKEAVSIYIIDVFDIMKNRWVMLKEEKIMGWLYI
jgi:hypothetical protein